MTESAYHLDLFQIQSTPSNTSRTSKPDSAGWPPPTRAALLYDRGLLAVPQLLDLCVLYGRTNAPLMRQLLTQLLALQPRYTGPYVCLCARPVCCIRHVFSTLQDAHTGHTAHTAHTGYTAHTGPVAQRTLLRCRKPRLTTCWPLLGGAERQRLASAGAGGAPC